MRNAAWEAHPTPARPDICSPDACSPDICSPLRRQCRTFARVPVAERVEDSIVSIMLDGAITLPQLDAHFSRMARYAAEISGPVATLVDIRPLDLASLSWAHASRAREHLAQLKPLLHGRYCADAWVSADTGTRRAMTALRFVIRTADHRRVFSSLVPARQWLRQQLAGVEG